MALVRCSLPKIDLPKSKYKCSRKTGTTYMTTEDLGPRPSAPVKLVRGWGGVNVAIVPDQNFINPCPNWHIS